MPCKVRSGEFQDWLTWDEEPFEHDVVGPFYYRVDENGPISAFRAEARHMNAAGVMHGGCLMTFADFSLFGIARQELGDDSNGSTIAFTSEFVQGPKAGDLISSRGEILKAGRSIIFARGVVKANDNVCLNFSGTIKRR